MPDTLQSLDITSDAWTNAYSETGITVGNQLVCKVQDGQVLVSVNATAPVQGTDGAIAYKRGDQFTNQTGDSGLWLKAVGDRALVNVSEL